MSLGDAKISLLHNFNQDITGYLKSAFKYIEDDYDFVIVDEAPDDSVILSNALRVADLVIIPVKPDRGSLKGLIVSVSKLLK